MPGLGPKRQGRHSPRSKAPYILMRERMRTFVVPEGLNTSDASPSLCARPVRGPPWHRSPDQDQLWGGPTLITATDLNPGASLPQLKPYVNKKVEVDAARASNWPPAETKPDPHSRRGGLYGPNGFDGHYYLQLAEAFRTPST